MQKTLLFIDDDEAFLEIVRRACAKIPAVGRLVEATDGAKGLEVIAAAAANDAIPDLAFVDINMPVLDGFGFLNGLSELRARHPALARMKPVAMLTSSDQERDRRRAHELGADVYIVKCVGIAATRETISRLV